MSVSSLVDKVGVFLSASGLPKMDVTSNTDAFAVLYLKGATGAYIKVGETVTVMDSREPAWATQFMIDYYFETVQEFKIKVFDHDGTAPNAQENKHELIGECVFKLSTVMCSPNLSVSCNLSLIAGSGAANRGQVNIRAEQVNVNVKDELLTDIICSKLQNKDGWFGKSDPFLRFMRVYEDGTWGLVHETKRVENDLNPKFLRLSIPIVSICNGDLDRPIRIDVWDHEDNGKHQAMGSVECSVRQLVQSGGSPFNVVEAEKKKKDKGYVNSGTLAIANCSIKTNPSFADFIMGGCEVSLVVGIDFTGSNGDVTSPTSLHYQDPTGQRPNQYQQTIASVGSVLQDYDSDHMYPVYGFGAKVKMPNGAFSPVQHCFPVFGGGVEVQGIEGIMQAYVACVNNVALSGPTLFTPLIDTSAQFARAANCTQERQKYTVLLIITDGEITDMDATKAAIVRASTAPISIIIIGVGGANFSSMQELDGDGGPLRSGGVACERDIVQFVSFRDFNNKGIQALASEVLAEVPKQCMDFMAKRNIKPNPPRLSPK